MYQYDIFLCTFRWRRHYKAGLYHANLAAVGANGYGANGYGYEHGSAYGESVVVKNKDLEEQSLCMYVPPEGDNELGEINFAFSEAALGQTQAGAAQTATAGANGHVNTGYVCEIQPDCRECLICSLLKSCYWIT